MAEYSKEWVKKNKLRMNYGFSITDEFYKLKEGKQINIICEGFGFLGIKNIDNECMLIDKENKLLSYKEVVGGDMEERDSFRSLIKLSICIAIAWILAWVLTVSFIPEDSKGMSRGEFGDMFGGINALFSGLALAGIIFTISLQRKELKLQRKELKSTREEFSIQNETLKRQRFENTFFQLLNLHQEIVGKLDYDKHFSRAVFKYAKGVLNRQFSIVKEYNLKEIGIQENSSKSIEDIKGEIYEGYYEGFYLKYFESVLSHYFRNLYHIFKYVYKSDLLSPDDKEFYSKIIRAQLSPDELILIFYNSLIDGLGNPKFLFLVKEFNILDNLNFDFIIEDFHKKVYDDAIKNVKNPFK